MPNDINSYRLTSLEKPPEEYLAQIMREAAEDAFISVKKKRQKSILRICGKKFKNRRNNGRHQTRPNAKRIS